MLFVVDIDIVAPTPLQLSDPLQTTSPTLIHAHAPTSASTYTSESVTYQNRILVCLRNDV